MTSNAQMNIKQQQQSVVNNILQYHYQNAEILYLYQLKGYWALVLECQPEKWWTLRQLQLVRCSINDTNIMTLTNLPLPTLQKLLLSNNDITKNGMKLLSKCPFANLSLQNLSNNNIGNKGANFLTKIGLPKIQEMYLYNCNIERDGAKHLGKSSWLNLQSLDLRENNIDSSGFELMSVTNSWKKLKELFAKNYNQKMKIGSMCLIAMVSENVQIHICSAKDDQIRRDIQDQLDRKSQRQL